MECEVETESNASMDVDEGQGVRKEVAGRKPLRGFTFGRGNFKKSFNTKSLDWHQRNQSCIKESVLDGSQLSKDLINSLQNENEEMK